MQRQWIWFLLMSLVCCTKQTSKPILINGAGASFPYILYTKWLYEYRKVNPQVAINYQSIGSGGGIRQLLKGTLDFGGTDVPVSPEELKKFPKTIVHIPMALGAVAVTYNLGHQISLKLDGKILSLIFMGQITRWDDPRIQKLNPNISLPKDPIVVVYRADGSGTTAVFTEFLSKTYKIFLQKIGRGKSVNWPVGVGGKGNEGVMGLVNKMRGTIAYVSLSYALSQKLPVAQIQNKHGQFIFPNAQSIKQSAYLSLQKNKSVKSSLVYSGERGAYPISSFTYIIIFKKMPKNRGQIIVNFLKWCLTHGQKFSKDLHFIPLPDSVIRRALQALSRIEYQ